MDHLDDDRDNHEDDDSIGVIRPEDRKAPLFFGRPCRISSEFQIHRPPQLWRLWQGNGDLDIHNQVTCLCRCILFEDIWKDLDTGRTGRRSH